MNRLTFEGNFCDIARCVGEYRMTSECADGPCYQRKVWERLKAYEETGLAPEHIEDIKARIRMAAKNAEIAITAAKESRITAKPKLHTLEEWHEDYGDVLWWKIPISEAPYCGSPLDSAWPGYHTHWTELIYPTDNDLMEAEKTLEGGHGNE